MCVLVVHTIYIKDYLPTVQWRSPHDRQTQSLGLLRSAPLVKMKVKTTSKNSTEGKQSNRAGSKHIINLNPQWQNRYDI